MNLPRKNNNSEILKFIVHHAMLEHTKEVSQEHPTGHFGGISVRKTCNRLKFSVRGMSSQAFLINAFCFRRDKNDILSTKIDQLGFSERQ